MASAWFLILFASFCVYVAQSACHNDCHRKGHCTLWNTCECFKGYEGNDCSRKSCPMGRPLADIATATDTAHGLVQCSNQGTCDFSTGTCQCNSGFTGKSCSSTKCYNDCNGRGECVSLRSAALLNDGYLFNRTTTYNQWDADVIFGCKCDPGYSGADCSVRSCEYGPDPRLDTLPRETVTLVCDCRDSAYCAGRFKLRFLGTVLKTWLRNDSRAFEVADAIMTTPGIFANNSGHVTAPVQATNITADSKLCEPNSITRTKIDFKRNQGDLPSLSFYANLFTRGKIYFETTQQLTCDCLHHGCNGTFRVSFDGEVSPKLKTWGNHGADVTTALLNMRTLQAANISVSSSSLGPICVPNKITNHTYVFAAQLGNVPRLGLWSSVAGARRPSYYNTDNTTNVLRIETFDGRDDNLKLCNGIGKCDFSTGNCRCPFGWEFNADLGPCGQLQMNTSRYAGLARCPGVATITSPLNDMSGSRNYQNLIYLAMNPTYHAKEGQGTAANPNNRTIAVIFRYAWRPDTITGPTVDSTTQYLFLNLSSNTSAGPIVLDATRDRMFFLDQHPNHPFIGIAPMRGEHGEYTKWLSLPYKVFGLTSDAHFKRRNLYWTVPGGHSDNRGDGGIYWANMDETNPTVHSLVAAIGQTHIVNPHGIAIHYKQQRIYWTDRNVSTQASIGVHGVLRSCNLDGSDVKNVIVLRKVDNITVSTNLTDLVIDFRKNNTAFILDSGSTPAVIGVSLDFPPNYNNDTEVRDAWEGMYPTRVVSSTFQITMEEPEYIYLDDQNNLVMWTDLKEQAISFQRYIAEPFDLFSPGVAFTPERDPVRIAQREWIPVGLAIDIGLGPALWNDVIQCYGNGICLGLEGNFECKCIRGSYGDCQARQCPVGKAWFHEPAVDEVAHDIYTECSSMGICDRGNGQCTCRAGYEGAACDRLSCPGRISTSSDCNGRGRCISMRNLALQHRNAYQSPDPVVYGSRASDPSTWDADMIYGCYPDEYGIANGDQRIVTPSGADLTRYECPVGYNVRLLDKVLARNATSSMLVTNYTNSREIQSIRCDASSGYFRLNFRGETSPKIFVNASAADLQTALQTMRTMGQVEVVFDAGLSQLCTTDNPYLNHATPNLAHVTFITQLGQVPLLTVSDSQLTGRWRTVTVQHEQVGSPEGLLECAGKGDCDYNTGVCRCWDRQGTSDGIGGPGANGDCGNYLV